MTRPCVNKAAYGTRLKWNDPEALNGDLCTHALFTLCDLTEITLLTLYQRNTNDTWMNYLNKKTWRKRNIAEFSLTRETLPYQGGRTNKTMFFLVGRSFNDVVEDIITFDMLSDPIIALKHRKFRFPCVPFKTAQTCLCRTRLKLCLWNQAYVYYKIFIYIRKYLRVSHLFRL